MASDDRLGDLLVEWEQGRRAGREPSLEELCRDVPELLPAMRESVDSVRATDWMFSPEPDDEEASSAGNGTKRPQGALVDTELPMSHLTVEEFAASIFQSGLLSKAEIDDLKERLLASALPGEAREIASKLVSEGKLTRYQASVLLKASKDPLLVDNYVILDTLDTGGMGLVFKALHRSMNRIVALKLLPAAMMSARDTVKRFQREVQAAAVLKHPNIVAAYDADESAEIAYLVLEYVEGTNLYRLVTERGPLGVAEAADYVRQAATGLAYLHSRGIIHRDVKPANLILANDGTVKLLDMGLVRFASSEDLSSADMDQQLTQAGLVIGTVAYMSPEQALDTRSADQRSDIYSLGCTLFFLLTGRSLYHEETGMKTLLAHREQPVPSIREFCEEAPVSLDAVFRTMVAKRPADRLQSMDEVIAALDACAPRLADRPRSTIAPRPALSKTEPKKMSRSWARWIVAAIVAVLVLPAAVGLAVMIVRIKSKSGTTEIQVDDPTAKVEISSQPDSRPGDIQRPNAGSPQETPKPRDFSRWTQGSGSSAQPSQPVPVVTATARRGDFQVSLSGLPGVVKASETVAVRTRVDGQIVKVLYIEGQFVHAGDPLVDIDERPYRTRLTQAESQVLRDEAKLEQARTELKRYQHLAAQKAIDPPALEAQTATVRQCEAALMNDRALIDDAKLQISYCHVKAPISGWIGMRLLDQGNVVQAGSTNLAVIKQLQPITVIFWVSQKDIASVQRKFHSEKGALIEAWQGTETRIETGKLVAIDNEVSPDQSVTAKAVFSNKDNRLLPNERLNVRLQVDTLHDVVIVPTAAVQQGPAQTFAYVVKPDNTVERRELTTGAANKDESAVKSGLSAGDVVVVEGTDKLRDGSKVDPRTRVATATASPPQSSVVSGSESDRFQQPPAPDHPSPEELLARSEKEPNDERAVAAWVVAHRGSYFRTSEAQKQFLVVVPGREFHIEFIHLTDPPMQSPLRPTFGIPQRFLERLAKLTRLKGLEFDCQGVNDSTLEGIATLTNLELLALRHASITDGGLRWLERLKRLRSLDLRDTAITDQGLKELARAKLFGEVPGGPAGKPWTPGAEPLLRLDRTRVTEAGIVEFQRAVPNCLVSAGHLMLPGDGRNSDELMLFPPPAGSNDRVWAEWLFRHVNDCRMVTDVDPDTLVAVVDSLPPIEFHVTGLQFGRESSKAQLWRQVGPDGQSHEGTRLPLSPLILRRLADLSRLETLTLGTAQDAWMPAVAKLSHLKFLAIASGDVGDEALKSIGQMKRLTTLVIESNRLTDEGLKDLGALVDLTTLSLGRARYLRGSGLKSLDSLKVLKNLSLPESAIDDGALEAVARFTGLESLDLHGTWISDKGLSKLVALSHLKVLNLAHCRRIDDGAFESLAKLGELTHLSLDGTRVTIDAVPEAREKLPRCRIDWPLQIQQDQASEMIMRYVLERYRQKQKPAQPVR